MEFNIFTFKLHINVVKTVNMSKRQIFIFFFFIIKYYSICIDDHNIQRIITTFFGLYFNRNIFMNT